MQPTNTVLTHNKILRDPRAGIINTLKRAEEKLYLALEWIVTFHFTTLPLLATRLGINDNTAFRFIARLKDKGIIRAVDAGTIRRELLLLTPTGLELCHEITEQIFNYHTEPSKVNYNRVRHDLYVQESLLNLLTPGDTFLSERQLSTEVSRKLPDAMICTSTGKIAIEVELTAKTDDRIYVGFENHIKALHQKIYHQVRYIFKTQTLLEYYLLRFNNEKWPAYGWDTRKRRWILLREKDHITQYYYPKDDLEIINKFTFCLHK